MEKFNLSFDFITENCKTVGDLKKRVEEVENANNKIS